MHFIEYFNVLPHLDRRRKGARRIPWIPGAAPALMLHLLPCLQNTPHAHQWHQHYDSSCVQLQECSTYYLVCKTHHTHISDINTTIPVVYIYKKMYTKVNASSTHIQNRKIELSLFLNSLVALKTGQGHWTWNENVQLHEK